MLQRISLTTADGQELFSGVSLLRSDPPPPPAAEMGATGAMAGDDYPEEDSQVRTPALLAKRSSPSNDNGSRPASHSTLRVAVPPPPNA
jgi:hypothetical protein